MLWSSLDLKQCSVQNQVSCSFTIFSTRSHWPCHGAGDCGSSCIAQVKPKGAVPMRSKNELSGARKTFWVLKFCKLSEFTKQHGYASPIVIRNQLLLKQNIWPSWKQPPGIPSFPNISSGRAPLQELHRRRAAWWPLQSLKHTRKYHTKMIWKIYGGFWNAGTQQPWVFLLKMMILECFGGTTI